MYVSISFCDFSMRFAIYIFCTQYIIFSNRFIFAIAKPMVGENVRQAKAGEFLSVVSIKYSDNQNRHPETDHECTGILVSRRDVLTAAHCFENYKLINIEIIVGSNDLQNGYKHYPLWRITYNEWAKQRRMRPKFPENDIAMLRLTANVNERISPAILSTISTSNLCGRTAIVAGWGKTITGEIPRFMETVSVTVLTKIECENRIEKLHGTKVSIDDRFLCTAADPFAILHNGDSGGPLLQMGTLIGINKSTCPFPDIEIHPEKINIHFSINFYKDFIRDVIRNYK